MLYLPTRVCRFEVYPYLEQFTIDVAKELRKELGGRPDFIIGNYSDGNLVASLLSNYLNTTMCTIAHALEKTKYPDADVHWCVWCSMSLHCLGGNKPAGHPRLPSSGIIGPQPSALWGFRKKLDHQYHFSCQFTADLIAMNASDFIITSTFQEIAGDVDTVGAMRNCTVVRNLGCLTEALNVYFEAEQRINDL